MAYANKYKITFTNVQNDTVTVYILEKDYADTAVIELEAGGSPLSIEYNSGDEDLFAPIRGSVAKIQYWNKGGYPLTTFASAADDKFKIEVYVDSIIGGNQLYWTGFIVQDDCSEPFLPAPNTVTLTATDNLGLLKGVRLNDALVTLYTKAPLTSFFERIFLQTGLELEVDVYCNVFENNMDDRADDPAFEPFSQTKLSTKTFIQSPSEWDSCYTVLEKILSAWNCTLFQANGRWVIIRWPELKLFTNAIPGTRYASDFTSPQQITLDVLRGVGKNHPIYPVNASHTKRISRPNKHTKLTFNYEQPYKLIPNDDLLALGAFISTTTIGDIRYDRYEATFWINTNSVPYYIQIETDISLPVPREVDRYLVIEYLAPASPPLNERRVVYPTQTIEVNQGDRFNFSVSFRGDSGTNDNGRHNYSIFLVGNSGAYYSLTQTGSSPYSLTWNVQGVLSNPPTFVGNGLQQSIISDDLTQWRTHDVFHDTDEELTPVFPEDGELYIFLWGFNNSASGTTPNAHIKDIQFTYYPYVNDSTLVTGHIHKAVNNNSIKKTLEKVIFVDDSPKNNIRGCMFLDDSTTKTSNWHRGTESEELQFGYIQKTDLLYITDSFRNRIEGDFNNLRDNSSYLFSLLNVFTFSTDLPGYYFILGQCKFDLKRCEFSGTLEEVWNTSDVYDASVYDNTFTYIYRTQ